VKTKVGANVPQGRSDRCSKRSNKKVKRRGHRGQKLAEKDAYFA